TEKFDGETYTGVVGTNLGTIINYAKTGVPPSGLSIGVYKGEFAFPLSVGALINLYAQDTQFNILSTPQIVTTDNQEAIINVSENIPYLKETRFYAYSTGQTGDIVKSYDYKDVGIILKITPQISQDKYVKLKISQEVTKLIESGEAPITAKRLADTTLIIPNGKTVVLGGLLRNDSQKTVSKVPFLGDIPLLGRLFRKDTTKEVKTNLMIFITPRIISSFEEAEKIKEEKEKIMKEKHG
ncbi:MAG: type II secretion system protein GspD, partial [Candidatus Omnitrophica bacterium]|nr:type II secretion system protein GspD [Candidatus Omnitrophota bacterium]